MATPSSPLPGEKSYFEQQRDHLVTEIAVAMEQVLNNMNTLNRNIESIVAVGREFESVEALWAEFENVMQKNPEASSTQDEEAPPTRKDAEAGGADSGDRDVSMS